jgi:hypothetical protein
VFLGVAAALGAGAVIWVLSASDGNAAGQRAAAAPAPVTDLGWGNPRVQRVAQWANAVRNRNSAALARASDLSALQIRLGVAPERPLIQASGSAKSELEALILASLSRSDTAAVFRDFAPTGGSLEGASMATGERGSVLLKMTARPDSPYARLAAGPGDASNEARVRVSFRMQGEALQVTGWDIVHAPPQPVAAAAAPPATATPPTPAPDPAPEPAPTPAPAPSTATPEPGPAEPVEQAAAPAVTLRRLGHLADTPPEQQREIDALIAELTDLSASPRVYTRAVNALAKIGRPAIPRLIDRMYEALPKKDADVPAVRRVVQALQQITGERFGYHVESLDASGVGATDEERRAALAQWYAWWERNRDRTGAPASEAGGDPLAPPSPAQPGPEGAGDPKK